MFREMRRSTQLLPACETAAILARASSGVLAVSGDDGYPYAVPLSFAYADDRLYFHCAAAGGHKLDAIRANEKVSFCVVDLDEVLPEKFTTRFRSVIVFGRAHVLEDTAEKRRALALLGEKYSPNLDAALQTEIDGALQRVAIFALSIDHMTGKEAIELTRRRA